ncbi:MAG: hypothetical protein RL632_705 [Bacteroidota bacterium]
MPMMKKLLIIISIFTAAQIEAIAQQVTTDTWLNTLIDQWHLDAAQAKFDDYFAITSEDFVFLGTAPGERWTKIEFQAFCKPYFDKGKAWDFKASNRQWTYSKNGKMAWFDEDLDTWMRGCRGSGILILEKGEWKLVYYNLTVLIENEKMKEFIELRDK